MIERQYLVKAVSEWQLYDLPETIGRNITIPLNLDLIVSIIGPRRAGKTFLMYDMVQFQSLGFYNSLPLVNKEEKS